MRYTTIRFVVVATLALICASPLAAQPVTLEYTDLSHALLGNRAPSIDTMTVDSGGTIAATSPNHVILQISGGTATVYSGSIGTSGYVDGPLASARFNYPRGLVYDSAGNLFVADQSNHVIRKITPSGMVSTFAGLGLIAGFVDGTGSSARFNAPAGLAIDANDSLFVADTGNGAIRKVTTGGVVTTIAGNGTQWTFADGSGSAARFYQPWQMTLGGDGNLYVNDYYTIRRVTPSGVVTTVVGSPGAYGSADGTGVAARLGGGAPLVAGPGGTLYFGDINNHTLRKISSTYDVTTVAGQAGSIGLIAGTGSYARLGNFESIVWNGSALQIADYFYYWGTPGAPTEVLWRSEPTIPDKVTIDLNPAPSSQPRQLDLNPQTATDWHWTLVSKPPASTMTFDSTIRNPLFTPDTGGTYRIQCRAANAAGVSINWLDFVSTCPTLPAPTVTKTAGVNPSCANGTITLTASDGYPSYSWSTGATTQAITVSPFQTSGYSVVGVDANGCRSSSGSYTQSVYNQPTPSSISSYDNPAWICLGASGLTVTATQWNNSLWSPYLTWGFRTTSGGAITVIPGASGPNYTIHGSDFPGGGKFYLVCINTPPCGLTPTTSNELVVNVEAPATVSVSASATQACASKLVTLTATVSNLPNRQYLSYYIDWFRNSTGRVVSECQNNPTCTTQVFPGDSYHAQVFTGVCYTQSETITVTTLPQPTTPAFTYGATCNGVTASVTNPNPSSTYMWSNGASGTSIIPATSGYYFVNETNASGCTGSSGSQYITQSGPPPAPTVTASGPTTFCEGGTVTLTASSGASYLWSNGATSRSVTVAQSGGYSVTVTNANACSGTSAPTSVTVNPLPAATVTASGPTTFCAGGSVTLTASAGSSYLWSNGVTTQSITVSASGSYLVTVTGPNGCSATSTPTAVTVNPLPVATITPSGPTTFCAGGSVTLSASAGSSYLWSNGATTQSITVGLSGSYSVTVANANGCSTTSSPTAVTVNAAPVPSITAGGPTTFCAGGSVTLSASAGSSYLWSNGATTQSIIVSASGSYSVIVANANGCSASSTPTEVTVNALPDTNITMSGPVTLCEGGSVTLTASPAASYQWSNGATTQSINVTASGGYFVTVTGPNGCSADSAVTYVTVDPLPTPTIAANGSTTFCQGGSVELTANVPDATYGWSNGATTQSISVTEAGDYTVTVTTAAGCAATSAATHVTVNPLPVATMTPSGPTTFCAGGSVTLTASAGSSYLWSNGATTQSITVNASGSHFVTVTGPNGCSATSAPTSVTVNPLPVATITPSGPITFCDGGSVTLSASAGSSYLWSNGATSQSIIAATSGNYSVTVTNGSGCSASSTPTTVTVNALPVVTITPSGPTTFCAGGNVTLSASAGSSYLWSNGATTQSIIATTSGDYSVTVTNASGCSATSSPTAVTVNALPVASIAASGPTTFCAGGSVTLTATAGSSYLWSNGATTQSIIATTSGNYSVTVTNTNGCSATSAPTAVTVNAAPVASITAGGPTTFCAGGSVTLTASSASSYLWSNGATTQSIIVASNGTFSVTIKNATGCVATSAPTTVTVNPLPAASITAGGPTTFCAGGSVTLTASAGSSYLWSNAATTQSIVAVTGGNYSVTVRNASGCGTTSAPIAITVNPATAITQPPQNVSIPRNTTATLTVAASGTGTLAYQWYQGASGDTSRPVGTNAPSYTTVRLLKGKYTFWVRVTAGCGTVNSSAATVTAQ